MAAKKGVKKTAKKKKGHRAGKMMSAPRYSARSCDIDTVCAYLKDLSEWLEWFEKDYTKLRKAVCNVEKKAWKEAGAVKHLRFCTGGTADDPPAPMKPPVWT